MALVFTLGLGGCSSSGSGTAGAPSGQPKSITGVEPSTTSGDQKVPDAKQLAARLSATEKASADFVAASEAQLTQVPTAFFTKGGIMRVQRNLPSHPALLFIGFSEELVITLTGNPDAFTKLASKAGLSLAKPEQRNGYVRAYFDTTRIMTKRFVIIDKVDEIKPRPNLSNDDKTRFEDILKKHAQTVTPLALSDQAPYKGTVFALKGQDLVRLDVTLSDSGEIGVKEIPVEKDVPIPYAR